MQWIQPHQRDRGGAIRIGENPVVVIDRIGIDFRDDERHLGVHAKSRAVIHHDTAALHRFVREFEGLVAPRTENRDVEPVEAFRRGLFDGPGFVLKGLCLSGRACGREQMKFRNGERSLVKKTNDFLTDCAGRTEDTYFICHLIT